MAADRTPRQVFFSGIEPVPASEVKASLDDFTTEERADGPSDAASSSSGGRRNIRGEPLGLSHIELIEATACHSWLWEYAETLEKEIQQTPRLGRPREHTVFEALMFEVASGFRGSYRDLARTFDDPKTWQRLQDTIAQAWPWPSPTATARQTDQQRTASPFPRTTPPRRNHSRAGSDRKRHMS